LRSVCHEPGCTPLEKNQVVLKVRTDATKKEIAQAVTMLFGDEVESVTTVNVKGKSKRFQQMKGRRNDWKKAYVRVPEGSSLLELFGGE
jgi:large subunit ribosomal protein L23